MPEPPPTRTFSTTRRIDFAGIEELKSAARTILWNCGINYSANRINRLCVEFWCRAERSGFAFLDFIAAKVALSAEQKARALSEPEMQRWISYADPTGEAAIRNVLNERKRP